jgi:hypothetical protein
VSEPGGGWRIASLLYGKAAETRVLPGLVDLAYVPAARVTRRRSLPG